MAKSIGSTLVEKFASRKARVAVIGLGYVGLPLSVAFAKAGFPVIGFDLDAAKVKAVNGGRQYIKHIPASDMREIAKKGGHATCDPTELLQADAILICVPTPLNRYREPDMSFIIGTAEMLSGVIRKGQLIVLESTTYPGTTNEVLRPVLEKSGLKAGRDFLLAFSPEREDPGGMGHSVGEIPKVIGGLAPTCLKAAQALYETVAPSTVPVSSLEVAEATKLLENIFRSVNIALVNELKQVFTRMGIDVWDVIEAARTKPFGFMPFYPGPGLGGHCIPIDPFYLTWKAREFECYTRFIELAGEINVAMPEYVVHRSSEALNSFKKSVNGSRVLILGAAYKKDVDDTRESPSLRLIELFLDQGAKVDYHDPFIPRMPKTRRYSFPFKSVPLTAKALDGYDLVVIAADHSQVDYVLLGEHAKLIVDTRNAMARVGKTQAVVIKA